MRVAEWTIVAALLLVASPASAFCRTTTCQPWTCTPNEECALCVDGGAPLYWKSRCVSFAVTYSGPQSGQLNAQDARALIAGAFVKWMSVDCRGDSPSLAVLDLGTVVCDQTGYDRDAPNINLWTFRDSSWAHQGRGRMLALTTVTYDAPTGEILDADVEINSFEHAMTMGDDEVVADLDSIVTHEAGHFLGLSHSCDPSATMFPAYTMGTTQMRALAPDDADAICSTFPPGIKKVCEPQPRGGLPECALDPSADDDTTEAGCSHSPSRRAPWSWTALVPLVALLRWLGRRRREAS